MMELFDVITINPNSSEGNQSDGNYSVSENKVYFGLPPNAPEDGIKCVCCVKHGAMLAVSRLKQGGLLYRCEACNAGAITKIING